MAIRIAEIIHTTIIAIYAPVRFPVRRRLCATNKYAQDLMPDVTGLARRFAEGKSFLPKIVPVIDGIRLQIPPTEVPTMKMAMYTVTVLNIKIRRMRAITYHTQ